MFLMFGQNGRICLFLNKMISKYNFPFFFAVTALLSNGVLASENQNKSMDYLNSTCQKNAQYDVYLSFFKMGELSRTLYWDAKKQQGKIETSSRVNVFGLGTRYHQLTHFYWSDKGLRLLTRDFKQTMLGFKNRVVSTVFSDNGKVADVTLNGEKTRYENNGKVIIDFDTLGEQIRLNVMNDIRTFSLTRQGTDELNPYQFSIEGEELVETESRGEVQAVRVKQTGNDNVTLWFDASLDYQLIQAKTHGVIDATIKLTSFKNTCNQSFD